MHQRVLLTSIGFVYYAIATYALIIFDAGHLLSAVVLFGVPAYVLARYSAASGAVVAAVATFGLGLAIITEGIGHIYGLWYIIGVEELRLFGVVPIEAVASLLLQTVFLTLLYELLFDDGNYREEYARERFAALLIFGVVALVGTFCYRSIFLTYYIPHVYFFYVLLLLCASFAMLTFSRTLTMKLLDRLIAYVSFAVVPLLSLFFVSVHGGYLLFAHAQEYLMNVSLFSISAPIEAFIMLLAYPLFVASFYELYLDDRR